MVSIRRSVLDALTLEVGTLRTQVDAAVGALAEVETPGPKGVHAGWKRFREKARAQADERRGR
jgi:hypothetical protein